MSAARRRAGLLRFLHFSLFPFLFSLGIACAHAQSYPAKPIRLLVPLAPGGGNDTTARLVGARLAESLGQQVVVENRPGAGSVIASDIVSKAPADGHTLYLVSTSFTAAPALVKKLPFDPLGDFTHVTRLAVVPAQDVLGLGDEARMNRPGRPEGNWTWRLEPGQLTDGLAARLRAETERGGRLPR